MVWACPTNAYKWLLESGVALTPSVGTSDADQPRFPNDNSPDREAEGANSTEK